MAKLDREDKILILISSILFIICGVEVILGFVFYPNTKWDMNYILILISSIVLWIFAILSFIVKKYKERKARK